MWRCKNDKRFIGCERHKLQKAARITETEKGAKNARITETVRGAKNCTKTARGAKTASGDFLSRFPFHGKTKWPPLFFYLDI